MKRLGPYWSVSHRRPQDYAYFKALQPTVFKIMDGGLPDYDWAKHNLPNSLLVARDHAMSEQKGDMLSDPTGTSRRHAEEWSNHQKRLEFNPAKTLIQGINEPAIWEAGVSEALRVYTIAMCDRARELNLRVGAMQLSVGWPANTGPDTPPDWSPFAGVEDAIRRGNHALVLHEYWADSGPGENWGWWAGRSLKCPWRVPIVIGECGVDMYVKDSSVQHNSRGWQGRMHANRYAAELAEYTVRMSTDPRFVGCCVFASDFANREWFSFDVEPAYDAILAANIPKVPVAESYTINIPTVTVGPARLLFVTAPAGLNLRKEPTTDAEIVTRLPHGTGVEVSVKQGDWWSVSGGWAHGEWLSPARPEPIPAPVVVTPPPVQPAGDDWSRIYAFIIRWEGGWADHPQDPGGATMSGITIGTYTRWREAHGQPKPTKTDLRNISDAEKQAIYREWYWKASGADRLSWPMNLAVMDTAVNGGVGRATDILQRSNGDFLRYMGILIDWYTRINNFEHFGRAWIRRRAEILLEASAK